jgi:hypothetical protein
VSSEEEEAPVRGAKLSPALVMRWTAVTTVAIAALVSVAPASAAGLPPTDATGYKFLPHVCKPFVSSGGFPQVAITVSGQSFVYKMPEKPFLAAKPHQIYQSVVIELQRRVLGGWKSASKRFTTQSTTKGRTNSGAYSVTRAYGPATADGATFRAKLTVRVNTVRTGLVDKRHWKYVVTGPEFSCPVISPLAG